MQVLDNAAAIANSTGLEIRQHNAITTARYEMTACEMDIVFYLLSLLKTAAFLAPTAEVATEGGWAMSAPLFAAVVEDTQVGATTTPPLSPSSSAAPLWSPASDVLLTPVTSVSTVGWPPASPSLKRERDADAVEPVKRKRVMWADDV